MGQGPSDVFKRAGAQVAVGLLCLGTTAAVIGIAVTIKIVATTLDLYYSYQKKDKV